VGQGAAEPEPEPWSNGLDGDACAAGEIERSICAVFGDAGPAAVRVAGCESGRNSEGILDGNWAIGNGSYGLFQIQASYHAARFPGFWERWAEVEFNIMMAWTLYVEHGYSWAPWSCGYAAW
jgi:hypothetical protein